MVQAESESEVVGSGNSDWGLVVLVLGRLLYGGGFGLALHAMPTYISEVWHSALHDAAPRCSLGNFGAVNGHRVARRRSAHLSTPLPLCVPLFHFVPRCLLPDFVAFFVASSRSPSRSASSLVRVSGRVPVSREPPAQHLSHVVSSFALLWPLPAMARLRCAFIRASCTSCPKRPSRTLLLLFF